MNKRKLKVETDISYLPLETATTPTAEEDHVMKLTLFRFHIYYLLLWKLNFHSLSKRSKQNRVTVVQNKKTSLENNKYKVFRLISSTLD